MICLDVKSIVAIGGGYKAGIFSYLKRYLIYAVLLGIMGSLCPCAVLVTGLEVWGGSVVEGVREACDLNAPVTRPLLCLDI